MITAHLTRHDGTDHNYDSIKWALETHVRCGSNLPWTEQFQYAVLTGNEDAPEKIEFWYDLSPSYDQKPDFIWTPHSNTIGHKVVITLTTEDNSSLNDTIRLALGLSGIVGHNVSVRHEVWRDEWLDDRDEDEDEGPF